MPTPAGVDINLNDGLPSIEFVSKNSSGDFESQTFLRKENIESVTGLQTKANLQIDGSYSKELNLLRVKMITGVDEHIDLGKVLNQPTWTDDLAGLQQALEDLGSDSGGIPIDPTLVLHLDASTSTSINTGTPINNDTVANWNDIGTLGNDALQASVPSQPVYKSSGFGVNSMPYLEFDRLTEWMDLGTAISKMPEHTVITVQEFSTITNTQMTLAEANAGLSTTSIGIQAGQIAGTNNRLLSAFSDGATYSQTRGTSLIGLAPYILTNQYTNGDNKIDFFINDVAETVSLLATGATSIGGTKAKMALGKYGDSTSSYFGGKLAEVMVWNRVLSGAELTTITDSLKTKYGI